MSAQPIRTTVLGAGLSLSAFHYPIITSHPELFTLHSVLERSADLTPDEKSGKSYTKSAAKDRCGEDVKVVKTLEDVTGDQAVELVVIGVPNNLHFEYAKKCMEAGKHGTSCVSCLYFALTLRRSHVGETDHHDVCGIAAVDRDCKEKQCRLDDVSEPTMVRSSLPLLTILDCLPLLLCVTGTLTSWPSSNF